MNAWVRVWRLAGRALWRDLRSGELRLLVVAVVLAVTALTAVGFFADRLQAGLQRDARQLLGGDAVVTSDQPAPAAFRTEAQARALAVTQTLTFPTMARAGEATKLVALKAVQAGYPLSGRLSVADAPQAAARQVSGIPAPGEVWADAAALDALGLQVGQDLFLGRAALRVSQVLRGEPDRELGFMNFAPRVLMNQADLAATDLIQPASRITYRLLVAGPSAEVAAFARWVQAQIAQDDRRGVRLTSLQDEPSDLNLTLVRAGQFLSLVALLAALLSAVAVVLAARHFAHQHLDSCALLRVLGLSQRSIAWSYVLEFVGVGLVASAVGVLLGFALHHVFFSLLADLLALTLPAASIWPGLLGMGLGLTLLLAFGLPPVLQLASVPPLRVMRRDLGALKPASWGALGAAVVGFVALLLAVSQNATLGWITVGGFAAAVLLFAAASGLSVKLLRRYMREAVAPRWLLLAARQMLARPTFVMLQVSALAVGLMALVLLVLLRTDLVNSWRQSAPPDTPDRFVINVMPDQAQDFQNTLRAAGVTGFDWFPMVRGRLIAINGQTVHAQDYTEARAQRLLDREFNLSYSATQPSHNKIVAGRWVAGEVGAVSVEEGIAQTLGLKLGDTLLFDVGGVQLSSRIRSLRSVNWGSMRANFFVLYPVDQLPEVATTFMSAFKAPNTPGFDNALVRQFPNVTPVDLSRVVAQIQSVLAQVTAAVEFLFIFTLAAGWVVLFAAVSTTREERTREFALMRALGASAGLLRQVQTAELLGVGLLAGVLAALFAGALAWALTYFVFGLAASVSWWVLLLGVLAGAGSAWIAGWWGLRPVLRQPVVESLRNARVY